MLKVCGCFGLIGLCTSCWLLCLQQRCRCGLQWLGSAILSRCCACNPAPVPSPRVVLVVLRLRLRSNLSLLGELLLVMQPAHGVAKTSRDGCRNSAWMLAGLAALHGGAVVVSGACAALKLWLGLLKVISSQMPWCLLPV